MLAHVSSEVTTLCTCWKITRRDATEFFFTDHDQDLTVSGDLYVSSEGYNRTAATSGSDMSVSNIDIEGMFSDDSITEEDLRKGLFDSSTVILTLVNWADVAMSPVILGHFITGDFLYTPSGVFKTTMYGIGQLLTHSVGDIYSPTCTVDLGSTRCGFDVATVAETGTVSTVASRSVFTAAVTGTNVDDWFNFGVLTWLTGANAGRSIEVRDWVQSSSTVTLYLPMAVAITVGDTFEVYPGCNKTVAHCRDKFDNIVNMQGFPYVPGQDYLVATPPRPPE